VTIGAMRLGARKYALRLTDGDERLFWITEAGDLLRVAVPATGMVATRTEVPRH